MARRMSRFIHLAMGAGKEAVARLGHRLRGDGPGRSATGSASSSTPAAAGSRRSSTAPTSTTRRARASSRRSRCRPCRARWAPCMLSMEYGLTGPVMTQVAACATSVIAFHDALRLIRAGECDVVLTGGSEAPIWPMGVAALAEHDRALEAQRRPGDRVAAVRRDARRVRPRRGRGRGRRRVARPRPGARRDARSPRSSAGALTADAFHISAPEPTGRGQARAMTLGAAQRRRRARRDRLHRRPRHVDAAQRRDRDAGDQGGLRRPRLQGRDQLAEVDDRPPRRRRRDRLGARGARGDPRRRHPADGQPAHARPGVRPRLRAARRRARRRSRRSRSTASGSAARTRSTIFRARRG